MPEAKDTRADPLQRSMKRIGILTAGGDTPALNATIHGAVVRANELGIEVYGLIKGFSGLLNPRAPHLRLNPLFQANPELNPKLVGTILGASRDYINPEDKQSHVEFVAACANFKSRA